MFKIKQNIAIIGGGPCALFVYKQFIEQNPADIKIDIFEANEKLGAGMPYSQDGANIEHVTNVSGNEIPELPISLKDWIQNLPFKTLQRFGINDHPFNDYKVLPRLLFGDYLSAQFDYLLQQAKEIGLETDIYCGHKVVDVCDDAQLQKIRVITANGLRADYTCVVICTGHNWPLSNEESQNRYFNSPYPPQKLAAVFNHEIAIRGSSLTAVDAIRTLARSNGKFVKEDPHKLSFHACRGAENFKIVMHSTHGLLPCIRFHLEDPYLPEKALLSPEDVESNVKQNGGFLSLDYIFEKDFKAAFRDRDPAFFKHIEAMTIEEFVDEMMGMREHAEPFELFKAEYDEAEKSINRRQSVYWKEMLSALSFAMNYPAKHFSAEDMIRLRQVLMPLISVVIAFLPQSSCKELLALNKAGRLDLVSVGTDSAVEADGDGIIYRYVAKDGTPIEKRYSTFIDCIGQRHLPMEEFPFKTLINDKTVSHAFFKFRSKKEGQRLMALGQERIRKFNDDYYLEVSGLAINDSFQAIEDTGVANSRLYIMAVPYISGYNPDYSGLDFCDEASKRVVTKILMTEKTNKREL